MARRKLPTGDGAVVRLRCSPVCRLPIAPRLLRQLAYAHDKTLLATGTSCFFCVTLNLQTPWPCAAKVLTHNVLVLEGCFRCRNVVLGVALLVPLCSAFSVPGVYVCFTKSACVRACVQACLSACLCACSRRQTHHWRLPPQKHLCTSQQTQGGEKQLSVASKCSGRVAST